ncbi:MAG: beta-ketoacyl synthase N-terminal-like domain-containing protein [Verrucomicrobia bacterium]|nr:beta-ketoacyl synthase N-terminal-like domain-containing protein [Verrucomicrobiota bacterium]
MSTKTSIAITGCGAVCGAGLGTDEIWSAILAGKSAVGPIEQWDAANWPVKISAEVRNVDNRTLVEDRKLHKMISRTDMFGLCAAHQAVQQSGLLTHRDTLADDAKTKFNDRTDRKSVVTRCGC